MVISAQLLNMDETKFCSRPETAKKRKVVYRTDCPIKPVCREQSSGCGCHTKELLSPDYEALDMLMIWFPSLSHFLQSLDLVMFAVLKMKH
jgi:hypothetical protein